MTALAHGVPEPAAIDLHAVPLALYVHLPWCVRKCPYCDFNSHALGGELPAEAYTDALLADLAYELRDLDSGRSIDSVFFGGGTPSLFPPEAIARVLDAAAAAPGLSADAEVTLEANPGASDEARFRGYRAAGVNRLSIGVQSFDDHRLAALGRIHDGARARGAVEAAHEAGFRNLNLDLMYGLPGQDVAGALADIEQALALAPTHLSLYQLTLEPGTQFARRPPPLPEEDRIAAMQAGSEQRLAAAGFDNYEVSAWAPAGCRCRHNLNYWQFGDYLGIGAGGHGKRSCTDGIQRRARVRSPRHWMAAAGGAAAVEEVRWLDRADRVGEFMLNALRLRDGVPVALFEERTGLGLDDAAGALGEARRRGLLDVSAARIRPTGLGLRFLNDLTALFLDPPDESRAGSPRGASASPVSPAEGESTWKP